MAIGKLTNKEVEIEIKGARKELEPLTNEQLILRVLASLVNHNLPSKTYYQIMASVLRERSEEKQIDTILNTFTRLSNEEIERIREEWF